jgi:N-formylglutamate amidohydrolase
LNSDLDKTEDRPDISLGVDYFHTPEWLVNKLKLSFEKNNLSVKINSPYSGTIIPLKYYNKDKRVMGIMIEVNKKLYLGDEDKIIGLNNIIRESLFS